MDKYIIWGLNGFIKGKGAYEALLGKDSVEFVVDFSYHNRADVHPIEDILKYPQHKVIINHSHTKSVLDFIAYHRPKNEFFATLIPYHPYSKWDPAEQREFYRQHKDELVEIFSHDELSLSILDNFLTIFSADKPLILPYNHERIKRFYSIDTKYFPEDIFLPTHDLTLIDCGAWQGDSAMNFISRFRQRVKKIALIEPSKENLEKAKENLKNYSNVSFEYINAGVSDKCSKGNFKFYEGSSMASHFEEADVESDSENSVKLVTLDSLDLKAEGTAIIKMDIEGFELQALKGATEYCRKYKPVLAFCLYHKSHDLYDLTKFVSDLGYRCYLRSPLHPVCYAVMD
ncbi:MAG: FkbM family methyltransferase [Succinivibrio sp.]